MVEVSLMSEDAPLLYIYIYIYSARCMISILTLISGAKHDNEEFLIKLKTRNLFKSS